jgi:hypothetical protein
MYQLCTCARAPSLSLDRSYVYLDGGGGGGGLDLGIDFTKIYQRTSVVLNPNSKVDNTVMADADLAGPFVFALGLGMLLLMVCLSPSA